VRQEKAHPAPDLVKRELTAPAPNRLWVADITYIPTWEGFLFLAVVLDVFSRRVVGLAMASHMKTDLVLNCIEGWCNTHRRHSALGYMSPLAYERVHALAS
jgi:putative transposase